jgi:hypothetical protein
MRSLYKSNVLTTIERINGTLKNAEKIILKISVQNLHSSIKVEVLLCNRRVKGKKASSETSAV